MNIKESKAAHLIDDDSIRALHVQIEDGDIVYDEIKDITYHALSPQLTPDNESADDN